MIDEEAREACRSSIESALCTYAAASELVEMPMVEDWVVVATFSDLAGDRGNGKWCHLRPKDSWSHRAVGLLITAADDLRDICKDED